ncbi:hypothetical protein BCR33DRAFT_791188 [Rhizoclosmatium globosum]|uniref:Uncharacterized protein n=1 Tax=Rhizoclosmatium globosum TaxID=329046 RepID=A0A1Y2BJ41_9FUNG|nr:hypothetical protein BCR33DRAFT_791188 [Rhizoclosmatium globosum]|eukprot:ORY34125.1 hypothetical protein BCR33DRAFT_791188 [Rhizoclosmatium globosum]
MPRSPKKFQKRTLKNSLKSESCTDWDPRNDVEPMKELNPSDDPVNSDDDSNTDGDNEGTGAPRPSTIPSSGGIESLLRKLLTSTPSTTWQPSTPFLPNSLLAAASSTNSTTPTPPHTVRGIMYSKDVIRATKAMQSDLCLHELVRYQAQNGLMKLIYSLPAHYW